MSHIPIKISLTGALSDGMPEGWGSDGSGDSALLVGKTVPESARLIV